MLLTPNAGSDDASQILPFWNRVAVKLMSAGISAGYSTVALLDSGGDRLASYAASRSVALLISMLVRAWARSRTAHRHDQHTIAIVRSRTASDHNRVASR